MFECKYCLDVIVLRDIDFVISGCEVYLINFLRKT